MAGDAVASLLPVEGCVIEIAGSFLGGKCFSNRLVTHDFFRVGNVLQRKDSRLFSRCEDRSKKKETAKSFRDVFMDYNSCLSLWRKR